MAIDLLVAGRYSPEGRLEVTPGQGGGRLAVPTDQKRKIKDLYAWPVGQGDAAQNGRETRAGFFFKFVLKFKCCQVHPFLEHRRNMQTLLDL